MVPYGPMQHSLGTANHLSTTGSFYVELRRTANRWQPKGIMLQVCISGLEVNTFEQLAGKSYQPWLFQFWNPRLVWSLPGWRMLLWPITTSTRRRMSSKCWPSSCNLARFLARYACPFSANDLAGGTSQSITTSWSATQSTWRMGMVSLFRRRVKLGNHINK